MIQLSVVSGPDKGRTARFPRDEVTLGRSVESDFRMNDPMVGAIHGRIVRRDGHMVYEDLGTQLGSTVQAGDQVFVLSARRGHASHAFVENVRVQLGESLLEVRLVGVSAGRPRPFGGDADDDASHASGAEDEESTSRLSDVDPRLAPLFALTRSLWTVGSPEEAFVMVASTITTAFQHAQAVAWWSVDHDAPQVWLSGGAACPGGTGPAGAAMARQAMARRQVISDFDADGNPRMAAPVAGAQGARGAWVVVNGRGRGFSGLDSDLMEACAAHVAAVLDRLGLEREAMAMFEGIVTMCVAAVDARDPSTAGHSERVSSLAVALADAVSDMGHPMDAARRETLRYAALLHDIGKIGVRESVLMKASRLTPVELNRIRDRIEAIRAWSQAGRRVEAPDGPVVDTIGWLDNLEWLIESSMEGRPLPDSVVATFQKAGYARWTDSRGRRRPVLEPNEVEALSIRRGTLTASEWVEMRDHVRRSEELLRRIPWPAAYADVPRIAALHHEKLDGTGYPLGVDASQLPPEARMLTIADIFDAMTGADRRYRATSTVDEACETLRREAAAGALDADLVEVFIERVVHGFTATACRKTG